MIQGRRVIAWTPYGRRLTYSILIEYLRRDVERGILDEVWACMNTDPTGQEDDIAYAHELDARYPWFHIKELPPGTERRPGPKQRSTGLFYRYMTEPETVYVRMDDDLVYVHPDAFKNLVERRLSDPGPAVIYGTVWNNAIVSWFAQKSNVLPATWGEVQSMYCMDPVGWADPNFAIGLHGYLLDHIAADSVESLYMYQDFPIPLGTQFSVMNFAAMGSMYLALPYGPGVLVPEEEEHWHSIFQPSVVGQPNILMGNAVFVHFAFFNQREKILQTDILDRYREQAARLTEKAPF